MKALSSFYRFEIALASGCAENSRRPDQDLKLLELDGERR
jgi:hypothetical protein